MVLIKWLVHWLESILEAVSGNPLLLLVCCLHKRLLVKQFMNMELRLEII